MLTRHGSSYCLWEKRKCFSAWSPKSTVFPWDLPTKRANLCWAPHEGTALRGRMLPQIFPKSRLFPIHWRSLCPLRCAERFICPAPLLRGSMRRRRRREKSCGLIPEMPPQAPCDALTLRRRESGGLIYLFSISNRESCTPTAVCRKLTAAPWSVCGSWALPSLICLR